MADEALGKEYIEQELFSLRESLSELITTSPVLDDFAKVWGRIGLSDSQRQVRRETMGVHINNLLKDIFQEEAELEKSMISSLQSNELELSDLCSKLGLPMETFPVKKSLYEREKDVRCCVDALNKVKFDRQKRLKRIKEMESSLCKEMGEKTQPCSKSQVPSEEELKSFLQRVETLEHTLNERRQTHHTLKDRVHELSAHLELELEGEFAVFAAKKKIVYTSDNMNLLEATFLKFEEYVKELERECNGLHQSVQSLWERLEVPLKQRTRIQEQTKGYGKRDIQVLREELQRLDELKRQHMEAFILKTRTELREIWVDCFFGVQQQREFAPAFVDGPFDDDLLSAHESELDRMRGFHHDNLDIFQLVKKREGLYKQYLEIERKDNDPMRFSNRGGQLLKDQALKKQLKKELPRIEKELKAVLAQWEEDHERFFMVQDSRYLDTIQLQWTEKKLTKCTEKVKRQKQKEALTLMEMTYGSKSTTPIKKSIKRAAASPLVATVPAKLRKVEQSPLVRPTTTAGSRLPRSAKTRSTKTPVRPLQRRQNDRRRILGDKNSLMAVDESFLSSHNFSLASAGSYNEFQHGIILTSETQKHCSSVIVPSANSP